MIDTIVLLLSPTEYRLHDPDKFTPSARWVITNTIIPGIQSKQNPSKQELRTGVYKPRLTIAHCRGIHGFTQSTLKIELSLPKLLFGNNFDELQYKDFVPLVDKLVATLHTMGMDVSTQVLAHAPVAAIHYSKNIALTDGSTPYHYINKIKEAHVPLTLDVNQTDYRNSGHCYKIHSNSYEVVFYDKIKDLQKAKQSDKRAIEQDNVLQLHLFENLRKHHKKLEILRMEVRLNTRKKIKHVFGQLNIKSELTLKKLFKPAIAKQILLHYLQKLAQKRPLLLDCAHNNTKALLIELITHNPDLTPNKTFQLLGLKSALEVMNQRELHRLFATHHARSWQRVLADAGKVKLSRVENEMEVIKGHLLKFKSIKLEGY